MKRKVKVYVRRRKLSAANSYGNRVPDTLDPLFEADEDFSIPSEFLDDLGVPKVIGAIYEFRVKLRPPRG